jgi:hypothetical protein
MTTRTRWYAVVSVPLLFGVAAACDNYEAGAPEEATGPLAPNTNVPGAGAPSSGMPNLPGSGTPSGAQGSNPPGSGAQPVGAEGPPPVGGLQPSEGGEGEGTAPPPGEGMPTEGMAGAPPVDGQPPVEMPAVRGQGPCDVYAAANTPCVAAYSTIRALTSAYQGPLYQVRRGAPNPFQNTGTGGQLQDIGLLPNGFANAAAQLAFCGDQACTVSKLYDQSGRGNDITVAKRGRTDGGEFGDDDDFESNAAGGSLTVGGNQVYSLFMEPRQGYRQTIAGNGMPRAQEAQGIYMLADGTRVGTVCCWDFGNVTTDPTEYHTMNTLNFGTTIWGLGAGNGPWFGADFEGGIWMGGTNQGDPGWGALREPAPRNTANPSLRVRFALGFLRTRGPGNGGNANGSWALRMADAATATDVTTGYDGGLPRRMDNQGAVVIGVGGDNSNNSYGTFFEGAVVAGYPSNEVELNVLRNIQAAGYGR